MPSARAEMPLSGRDRRYIKGQKYTLLSRRENLTLEGRQALKTLLRATNDRTPPTCSRNPSDSCRATNRRASRGVFENWRRRSMAALAALREVRRHDRPPLDGIAAYCKPENKVSLGFVEGLQQQSPRLPATRLRPARQDSSPQGSHLHAAAALTDVLPR